MSVVNLSQMLLFLVYRLDNPYATKSNKIQQASQLNLQVHSGLFDLNHAI